MNFLQRENLMFPFCEDSSKYEKVAKIGQGRFGEVFKAREKNKDEFVAMKSVLIENKRGGLLYAGVREITILELLKHENVVKLLEIFRIKATAQNKYRSESYLMFEFCEHDLAGLLANVNVKFNLGEIKKVMQQMLNGLYYVHNNKILHRDMKPANILITKNGILKLADFGLARAFSLAKTNNYRNPVATLWYRAPELLLGDCNYGPPVDMWGVGCIMAEMWTRSPIMRGSTEQHQLVLISQLCGSCTPDVWPEVVTLDLYHIIKMPKGQKRKVKKRLKPHVKDPYGCDLLDKLLQLDPSRRYDCRAALNHNFFRTDPMPCDLAVMLAQHTQSMFEYLAPPRRPAYWPRT